ncbi:MAG: UvrD-helicase domain-containing protein [Patescibacteria group bacterium]|nr:UvrD-helicase domain-containing protein [Patescibacteria group bacterium]
MIDLSGLNPAQKEAVTHKEGPLLIVAGAGSGKTKAITYRIGQLIDGGVEPEKILAITFTNKAAKEMGKRISKLLGGAWGDEGRRGPASPFVSTFHALGAYILKENAGALGLNRFFSIADKDDSMSIVKGLLKDRGIESREVEPRRILGIISREKGNLVTADSFREKASKGQWPPMKIAAIIWPLYEQALAKRQALDFDDLLLKVVKLLQKESKILEYYQRRWPYLHIDEYQDTNVAQYELAKLLAAKSQNICVVGDVDQSIYSWRGADFKNLMRFEKDYKEAKIILLEENYRSTQTILTAANQVISKNQQRHDKKLFTKNPDGELIQFMVGIDEGEEASMVANEIQGLLKEKTEASEIAILYRANFQSRILEEALLRAGLPYQVLGTRFFERKEVRDVLAVIRAALNPEDWESKKRIINVPPRGIGKVTLGKMAAGLSESLPAKTRVKIAAFDKVLAEIKEAALKEKPSDLIKFAIKHSGLEEELKKDGPEGEERLGNLRELATLALKYDQFPPGEGTWQMLTDASLTSEQDSLDQKQSGRKAGVRLMTVHAAKGLEFKYVFIVGMEQGLFPYVRFGEDEERDGEEERRLFYVALTRARERLYLSYAQSRTIFGSRRVNLPSDFLADIDDNLLADRNTPLISIDF